MTGPISHEKKSRRVFPIGIYYEEKNVLHIVDYIYISFLFFQMLEILHSTETSLHSQHYIVMALKRDFVFFPSCECVQEKL